MPKFVSDKPITNGRMEELERKFTGIYPRAFLTGGLVGGNWSTKGSVGWTVVLQWEPHICCILRRGEDAASLIVERQEGDIAPFIDLLQKEGFTFSE